MLQLIDNLRFSMPQRSYDVFADDAQADLRSGLHIHQVVSSHLPSMGPNIVPIDQTKGMMEYALGSCSGFVTSSPTMVWITPTNLLDLFVLSTLPILPTFPLRSPPSTRPVKAIVKLLEKPTTSSETQVPKHPSSNTGFRPIRSDNEPHHMLDVASAKEKEAIRIPHQKEASFLLPTWKSDTMSQAYGKMLVIAMGSAKRHKAGDVSSAVY